MKVTDLIILGKAYVSLKTKNVGNRLLHTAEAQTAQEKARIT